MSESTNISLLPLSRIAYADWLALWNGYLVFYEADLPVELAQRNYERMCEAGGDCHGCCALVGGTPAGIAHWIFHRTNWASADSCYPQDLFVAPAFRGHGVARALIEYAGEQAGARGCAKMHWLTQSSNGRAMYLYDKVAERSGFVEYEKHLAG